jgi:hypothetical protein
VCGEKLWQKSCGKKVVAKKLWQKNCHKKIATFFVAE